MTEITVPCEPCAGTGWATHEDRHAETNRDVCTACGGAGQVPARPGESRETSWPFAVPGATLPANRATSRSDTEDVEESVGQAAAAFRVPQRSVQSTQNSKRRSGNYFYVSTRPDRLFMSRHTLPIKIGRKLGYATALQYQLSYIPVASMRKWVSLRGLYFVDRFPHAPRMSRHLSVNIFSNVYLCLTGKYALQSAGLAGIFRLSSFFQNFLFSEMVMRMSRQSDHPTVVAGQDDLSNLTIISRSIKQFCHESYCDIYLFDRPVFAFSRWWRPLFFIRKILTEMGGAVNARIASTSTSARLEGIHAP